MMVQKDHPAPVPFPGINQPLTIGLQSEEDQLRRPLPGFKGILSEHDTKRVLSRLIFRHTNYSFRIFHSKTAARHASSAYFGYFLIIFQTFISGIVSEVIVSGERIPLARGDSTPGIRPYDACKKNPCANGGRCRKANRARVNELCNKYLY